MMDLPIEVIMKILRLLSHTDLKNFARTCKYFKELAYDKHLWVNTQVYIKLLNDLTGYHETYQSFNIRNFSNLHFNVSSYTVLVSHLFLIQNFFPNLNLLCDLNKNIAPKVVEELTEVHPLRLTNLNFLVLSNFDRNIFKVFENVLKSVSYLCISHTTFDDELADEIVNYKTLKALNISRTLISNSGIQTICGMRQTKSRPTSHKNSESLYNIEIMDISNNINVNQNCFEFLEGLPKLKILVVSYIHENYWNDDSLQKLLNLKSLRSLSLDNCNTPGAVISALSGTDSDSKLECLSFKCDIRDMDLLRLNSSLVFTNITFLKITSACITDNGINSICQYVKNLIVLDIRNCENVTDVSLANICTSLGKLKVLCVKGCNKISATEINQKRELSKDRLIESDFSFENPDFSFENPDFSFENPDFRKITEGTLREALFFYQLVNYVFFGIQNCNMNELM